MAVKTNTVYLTAYDVKKTGDSCASTIAAGKTVNIKMDTANDWSGKIIVSYNDGADKTLELSYASEHSANGNIVLSASGYVTISDIQVQIAEQSEYVSNIPPVCGTVTITATY